MPLMVRQAWKTMITGRPGPVVLDVPFDILRKRRQVKHLILHFGQRIFRHAAGLTQKA